MLTNWEKNAPDDVKEASREDLPEMGTYAKGACNRMLKVLGDCVYREADFGLTKYAPSDYARIFFDSLGKYAVPALIVSMIRKTPDIEGEYEFYYKKCADSYARILLYKYFNRSIVNASDCVKWYIGLKE